jgi:hypothetical protein
VGIQSFTSSVEAAKTIKFPAVKANDITEGLTLQFTTVNGVPVANASRNGLLMITTRSSYRDATGFDLSGHDRDGFNRAGYNAMGYDKNGYNEAGYDRNGYNRSGFDSEGFNKEGYGTDGSRYNAEGYNREGYNKSGYKKWSPISSLVEALGTGVWRTGNEEPYLEFTLGLLGAYCSIAYGNEDEFSFGDEFVVGYTLNVLPEKKGMILWGFVPWGLGVSWGLGVPLGIGYNNLENQVVLEAGLQLRFLLWEIRGTYRTTGFRDNGFTISAGWCLWSF